MLLLLVVFIVVIILGVIITKNVEDGANKLLKNAMSSYEWMLNRVGIKSASEESLIEADNRARDKVFSLLSKYDLCENNIYDTKSSLGICAFTHQTLLVSLEAHDGNSNSHANAELFSYFKNNDRDKHKATIKNLVEFATEEKIEELRNHLRVVVEVLEHSIRITNGRTIKAKNIAYYKVDGYSQYVSDVKGGGANLAGAVYGGIIAGGAGAVVGSQLGTDIKTDIVKKDDRKLFLYYNVDGVVKSEEIITNNIDYILNLLREWMPDKEYSHIAVKHNTNPTETKALSHNDSPKIEERTIPAKHSYAELKELKELLDLGIITQEEFDRKKQEILA